MVNNLPIGIDSFRKIREEGKYYVDKTLMIRDFIIFGDEVALITRPRRFGKTLNMTMLRKFEVISIPGHTPGSIALLDIQNRILIAGDSVLDDVIAMSGCWRNFDAYICSMEKLCKMRDRFDTVYTSHATFPLSPDIIDGLVIGAIKCKSGEILGMDVGDIRAGSKSAEEKNRLIALLEDLQATNKDIRLYDAVVATFAYYTRGRKDLQN